MSDQTLVVDDPASLFRKVLGHLPTGVTVVATLDDDRPVGLAVGSFFSVSLEPPLVGFCVMTTSTTWPVIERCGRFGVSVLAAGQTDICRRLATKIPLSSHSPQTVPGESSPFASRTRQRVGSRIASHPPDTSAPRWPARSFTWWF